MIELGPEAMAEAMEARVVSRGPDHPPERASIDSREVTGGEIFFGLSGGSDDGGAFAGAALEQGAWGAVVSPDRAERLRAGAGVSPSGTGEAGGNWIFAAPDPLRSLQMLARSWRREVDPVVVGITGSVGKTSVKDITRAILPGRVHASEENFNTEIGLPLTVLGAPPDVEFLVLEMAMRGPGQIAELAEIAEPVVGVITNVGPVHIELLGSVEAVAAAKAELIDGLTPGGTLVAPAEAGLLEAHLGRAPNLIRFGDGGEVCAGSSRVEGGRTVAEVNTPEGSREFEFPFTESHNLTNALTAIAAGLAAGASLDVMAAGAGTIAFSRFRGELVDLGDRGLVINDCYNANPVSMRAALENLAGFGGPTVAVLGVMAELGPDQARYHAGIGEYAKELGIGTVVGVGTAAREYLPDVWAEDAAAAARAVEPMLGPETRVLVKGSRSAGLEAVTAQLAGESDRDTVR